ncbi:hypothetical protein [Leptotrichia alba]|uniref:Uncharacterized protein n=1 Tax=Leptotrichia alba TaxID=3239304 RepID=A0AB39V2C8_9FUSO
MNVLNKEKFNQYGKLKLYIVACFGMFSLSVFSEGSKNPFNTRRVGDDALKIDIIINKDDINDYEEDIEDTYKKEGDLIYLDQIKDEKENEIKKKNEKLNKLERFIRKIDEKFNPLIKFQIGKSYGTWYLIKTEDISETKLENVQYDFIQEQNGYKLVKSYFDPETNVWSENNQRAWIEEKKGNVYLDIEEKYFKNNKNKILFFDKNYQYMIIKFNDGFTKVLSRYPNNEKILLEGKELTEFNQLMEKRENLRDVFYNKNIKSIRQIETERKKEELKRKTDELERQLSENPAQVFQIDTIGARRAFEKEMGNQKEKTAKFETKNGTEKVKVIELDDKDLKNGNEIENNDNRTEINKKK